MPEPPLPPAKHQTPAVSTAVVWTAVVWTVMSEINCFHFLLLFRFALVPKGPQHSGRGNFQDSQGYTKKTKSGAGEMVQQLRALTTLLEDLESIPDIHMLGGSHP